MKKLLSLLLAVSLLFSAPAEALLKAVASGSGGTIGGQVSGGTANQILYVNASGNLAGSANLTFNGTTLTAAGLTVTGAISASPANANVTLSPTGTGTVTINPATASTMDNVAVGLTIPLAAKFTTVNGTTGTFTDTTSGQPPLVVNGKAGFQTLGIRVNSGNTAYLATISSSDESLEIQNSGGVNLFKFGNAGQHISYGNIQPDTAGSRDLGLATTGWKRLYIDYTNTATVGAVTINKAAGRVNLAAAGTSLVVTNSLVTAASHIFLNAASAPGNAVAVLFNAVPAAGSFTINAVPAVTNQTAIDFIVVNAD